MTPIETMLNEVKWEVLPASESGDSPYATHTGVLDIGGVGLRVYQLNDGQRVIDAEDMRSLFEGMAQ
jgi:hypothetical protein